MSHISSLTLASIMILASNQVIANSLDLSKQHSYAEEYMKLRVLLQNVTDIESAKQYKMDIEKEIQQLSASQPSGGEYFRSLSKDERKLFIKRFQQNRFHCGEVTQVMQERRRILFDPELSSVLSETLANMP